MITNRTSSSRSKKSKLQLPTLESEIDKKSTKLFKNSKSLDLQLSKNSKSLDLQLSKNSK
jgi:hypothetical protein